MTALVPSPRRRWATLATPDEWSTLPRDDPACRAVWPGLTLHTMENTNPQSQPPATIDDLVARLEKLEARVRELERLQEIEDTRRLEASEYDNPGAL